MTTREQMITLIDLACEIYYRRDKWYQRLKDFEESGSNNMNKFNAERIYGEYNDLISTFSLEELYFDL